MPERSQVNPNLVGASGFQPAFQKRDILETLEHAKARHRALAPTLSGDSHPYPRALIAPDGLIDNSARRLDRSLREADVAPRHAAAGELRGEGIVRCGG